MRYLMCMPSKYNPQKIEKKWQKVWEQKKLYKTSNTSQKKKYYALIEFPYPSGDGLHVGHVRSYTAMDIVARKRRMQGHNVLYPIGWDAFGLPTENYAIKTGSHPKIVTKRNTDTFRRQLKSLGFSFDWSREINTTDPDYYKWTQWIFLKFFEAGLAYKARTFINWCTKCKIGLANEEVVAGRCERCGGEVVRREKEQWMLKITAYAEKLLKGLQDVDYIPEAKIQQENWIGRSEGATIKFKVQSSKFKINEEIEIFTTRADTLFGATYLALSPEHKLIAKRKMQIVNWKEVESYITATKKKTDIEHTAEGKEKTGMELKGIKAINPATKEEIPIWVSDYVLAGYGTGAIMAVPAHDERDFEFAKKFGLPVREVIQQPNVSVLNTAYAGEGVLVNSSSFTGMQSIEAKKAIAEFVGGKITIQYKLRDWIFSRQRYWGEPIPLIFCERCKKLIKSSKFKVQSSKFIKGELLNPGWIPIKEKDLPVELPHVKSYTPTDTGESPLAGIASWVRVKCPRCGGAARRETDVMPNWAGSSWYFLAYLMSKKAFKNKTSIGNWKLEIGNFRHFMPVDWYNGGMEHTVLHLLYSRFWNQFLHDIKLVPTAEPYKKRTSHGLILGEGGDKMSKSRGNVVNPDMLVREFGADALRMYEMFIGPFNQAAVWDPRGIIGTRRFLERTWNLISNFQKPSSKQDLISKNKSSNQKRIEQLLHQTIKKVSEDIENLRINTAVSSLMILLNEMEKSEIRNPKFEMSCKKTFLRLLAPFAPHIAEELWQKSGGKKSVHLEPWPKFDKTLITEDIITLVVQVNGKMRATLKASIGISQKEVERLAFADVRVIKALDGKHPARVIYVPGKLINFVL